MDKQNMAMPGGAKREKSSTFLRNNNDRFTMMAGRRYPDKRGGPLLRCADLPYRQHDYIGALAALHSYKRMCRFMTRLMDRRARKSAYCAGGWAYRCQIRVAGRRRRAAGEIRIITADCRSFIPSLAGGFITICRCGKRRVSEVKRAWR